TEAQKTGVVEVRIHYPLERCSDIEEELRTRLGLKTVHILARGTLSHEQMLRRLGELAARLVETLIAPNMVMGVSWGTALREVTNALRPRSYTGIKVVQIIGALDAPDPDIDGPDLARSLARIFGGQYFTLPAPLLVDSETTRDALMSDPRLGRILGMTDNMQMTLTGIGTVDRGYSSLVRAGYLSYSRLAELASMNAVGDVCAIHFDIDGHILDVPLHRRRVGISPERMAKIPIKVGVGGGESKALPLLGACRAGLVTHLVTDEVAALKAIRAMEGDDIV
ncbi:MAG TPA: sugar-binding domain-containing protein, partial [Anaerolineaceae bacterium]